MGKLKCVIFDMDGTLTQTHQLILDSFNYIAMKYEGKTYSMPEVTAMFGPPEEGALLGVVGQEKIDEAMKVYLDFYRDHHNELAQLHDGILELLRYLKDRGVHLALFTGKGIHTTTITMEKFGLKPYFEFVVTGNDVVNHKPSGEGIQKITNHFGITPEDALMVGDSVGDGKASHEAGVKFAAVLWDSHANHKVLQMKTDYVFPTVADFSSWIRRQFD